MGESRGSSSNRLWCSDRLRDLFERNSWQSRWEDGFALLEKRRLLDFGIANCRVSARLQNAEQGFSTVEIGFPEIAPEVWDEIFDALSGTAFYLAKLLSGNLPTEIERVFSDSGTTFLPESLSRLEFYVDLKPLAEPTVEVAALVHALCREIETNPMLIFPLRGKGQQEALIEIHNRRRLLYEGRSTDSDLMGRASVDECTAFATDNLDEFWKAGEELGGISYSLRADELPASVLKRLDFIPLSGLEDDVDRLLEEAYVQVATRAQAFAFGLNPVDLDKG